MELDNEEHEVSIYISHDVPYKGVNVPLGLLYAVNDLFNYFKINTPVGLIATLASKMKLLKVYNLYNATSARQMLINYVNSSGYINNTAHNTFFSEFNSMGFPKGDNGCPIENVAIINGGTIPSNRIVNTNGHILDMSFSASSGIVLDLLMHPFIDLLADLLAMIPSMPFLGKMQIDGCVNIYPFIQNSGILSNINITYTKKFLWIFPKTYPILCSTHTAPSYGTAYDAIKGSLYNTSLILEDFDIQHNNVPFIYKFNATIDIADYIMFVPTASSLYVSNFNTDYYSTPPTPLSNTPFSSFYLNNYAQTHIFFDSTDHGDWLKEVLETNIAGPDIVSNNTNFSVVGGSDNSASYLWSSSNNNVLAINPNTGAATSSGNGVTTITARSYNNGRMYQKQKKVAVGFPSIALTQSPGAVDTCKIVSITCTDEDFTPLFQQLISSGDYMVQWGVKIDDENISWLTPSNETSKVFSIEDPTKRVTIYCKIKNTYGAEGTPSMIIINKFEPFECLTTVQITRRFVSGQANGYYITIDGNQHILNPPRIPFFPEQFLFQYSSPEMSLLAPEPDTVVVNNQYSFPVTKYTEYLPDNTPVEFFGFDLFNSTFFLSHFIDPDYNYLQLLIPVTFSFRKNGETIQEIYYCINGNFFH